ncbi:MAG TPA: DUF3099 domain-containing protein [Trebonia sp.]|jgi:hypothetical protein|nr:DUF3099 domain-containing protein [Trebonia sp.]
MRPGNRPEHRPGLAMRERWYLALMGGCLLLIVLAWTVIYRYSGAAAIAMSAVALLVPPFAVIIANASGANRQ